MNKISHKKEKNKRKKLNKIKRQKENARLFPLIDSLKENKKNIIDNEEKTIVVKENKNSQKQEKDKYNYIITSNIKNGESILNQFICLECYNINLVEESQSQETKLYEDKNLKCRKCKKNTPQICLKDKMLTLANLKISNSRTANEEKAYQALKNKSKQKIKKSYKG